MRKVASYHKHVYPWKLLVAFIVLAIALPWLSYVGLAKGAAPFLKLPSKENFHPTQTIFYDRSGTKLYETAGGHQPVPVKLNQVPRSVVLATLAAEDSDFYKHRGVNPEALGRATYKTLVSNDPQGGSTITQQLIKNTYLSSDRTATRKLKEMTYAIVLEQKFTKDQILERYLNEVYYGQQSYGIADGAKTYFGKDLNQLTLGEASMLAGLPSSPTRYSPLGSNPQLGKERQKYVLDRMVKLGYVTKEQATTAAAEPLTYAKSEQVFHAPHFVFFVKNELAKYYGDDTVDSGGLKVYTTLDLNKQADLEKEVADGVKSVARYNATNGAGVAMDPKTGEVLAMVGSADFNNDAIDGKVNVATSLRQPGSSFKPFVYLEALQQGKSANTILHDKPTTWGDFTPKNYDGGYHGNVTMRYALASSLNIPAVEMLDQTGIQPSIDLAHQMGITTLNDTSRYGLSLVLGGGEVKLLDMVSGFSVMANKGQSVGRATVNKVVAPGDKTLYERKPQPKQVVDEGNAFIMTDILSDARARTTGFGNSTPLDLPGRQAAVKTGTTNNFKDNWTVGYTPSLVVGIWVGNSNGDAMRGISGVQGAAPIWHDVMVTLLKGTPVEKFDPPKNVVRRCACVGGLGGGIQEWFLKSLSVGQPGSQDSPQAIPSGTFESETPPPAINGRYPYWTTDAEGKRHYYYQ